MAPGDLLRELDSLPFSGRMARMVEIGRASLEDAGLRELLAEWEQGEWYERFLSLQACYGSGNGARVLRSVGDPSRGIRGLALKLAGHVCDDEQVLAALRQLPKAARQALLRQLVKVGRRNAVDPYLASLAAGRDPELGRYLAYGSAETAEAHLEQVAEAASDTDWQRVARHHPRIAAAHLLSRARAESGPNPRLRWQANAVLDRLARFCPDQALTLVEQLLQHSPPDQIALEGLSRRRPTKLVDLLLTMEGRARLNLAPVAHRLDPARLLAVLEHRLQLLPDPVYWFGRLAPGSRAEVYRQMEYRWRWKDGTFPLELAADLPGVARAAEGRRHLSLPELATREAERIEYTCLLPWDEATPVLKPYLGNPDPNLRAVALSARIRSARYQRERLPDVLALVRARPFEQDPVRNAMLGALADLPPARWQAERLEDLSAILRAMLDAADLSQATAAHAERLILALLPFHPEWAAGWLGTLVQERGRISFGDLEDRISDRTARQIAPALLPVLEEWEARERQQHLIAAARSLGRRLKVLPELVEILERVIGSTRERWVAATGLILIQQHRPQRAAELIPELLHADPSWITQSPVYEHLHLRRQDLLGPFLGRQAYGGRFSTGKTAFVLPVRDGFGRWTPAQQETFAETLYAVIRDSGRDSPSIFFSLSRLAELPAISPRFLLRLARVENRKTAVRDIALRALGRLDAGQGVPHLVEALEDERARVAIYALRQALLEMPAPQALAFLRAVPREKVTVAKEVVRLLGDLPGEEAYRALLAFNEEELHRDVRVALLRALWEHLEREETWPLLEQAATSPDAALATAVSRVPATRLSPAAGRRLCQLLTRLLQHPDPAVRSAALQRCNDLPVADPERVLLAPILACLDSPVPPLQRNASQALLATYHGKDDPAIAEALRGMLGNRRAVHTLILLVETRAIWEAGRQRPLARKLLPVLESDPLTVALQLQLALSALPWKEGGALLTRLADAGLLHADAIATAAGKLAQSDYRSDSAELAALERSLAASDDERLRRLGLAALLGCVDRTGWTAEQRERLEAYRRDPSPLVAGAAQFTFLPDEGSET